MDASALTTQRGRKAWHVPTLIVGLLRDGRSVDKLSQ
jgi:hypothetical protein